MRKKSGMLKIRYAKNTYGPKCQNTHGPKLWLLDTWAWAHGPAPMGPGRRRRGSVWYQEGEGGGGGGPGSGPMGPCPCVQEPKLLPMSILTFGPISIFSIPGF